VICGSPRFTFATHGGAHDEQAVLAGFESAKGFIKRELARELGLRYMPDLKFFYDASFDYGAHINRVLKSIQTDDEKIIQQLTSSDCVLLASHSNPDGDAIGALAGHGSCA
jgi:hypothetical protein